MLKIINPKHLYYAVLFYSFLIPLSQFCSVRLLVVILGLSFFVNSKNRNFKFADTSWDILIYLTVIVLGLVYSNDLRTGFKVMETSFSLLALPIVFYRLGPLTKEKLNSISISFISGVISGSLICLIYSLFGFIESGDVNGFFFDSFTEVINSHPTYFAYYICFSLTLGLYLLYYEENKKATVWLIVALIFLFIILMMTGGRTAYISLLFVFSFFILKFLFEDDWVFIKKLTFGLSILFLIGMLAISHYNFHLILKDGNGEGDYWERLSLWKSAVDANNSLIFGVGTGDYKQIMNEYYVTHNLSQFASDSFNAHNQLLQSFFTNGLIGLLSVVILLARPLYLSVKYQNVLGILVFFSFLIYGMTEVFLGRYQGVVFFALLHQGFIHFYYSRQSSFSLKEI